MHSKFKIGAGTSAAAGPVGRHAQVSTDILLNAELLTYSRAKGVFAGVDLNEPLPGLAKKIDYSPCGWLETLILPMRLSNPNWNDGATYSLGKYESGIVVRFPSRTFE